MILDSHPPQCPGPLIDGWDWSAVLGEESVAGTSWGHYFLRGIWDGEVFTLSHPPVPFTPRSAENGSDPSGTPCEARRAPVLPELRETVTDIVTTMTDLADGCVVVQVAYDDGTLQAAVDKRFGANAIVIGTSFMPLDAD
jgi:hypothetical protein